MSRTDTTPLEAEQPAPQGHRERIKAQRRRDIECAAMRLFADQGYEETTVAQIAHAANVSARTVSMYFAAKADLVAESPRECVTRLLQHLADAPSDQRILTIFASWLESEHEFMDPELMELRRSAYLRNPQLRGVAMAQGETAVDIARQKIGRELGRPANHLEVNIALLACMGIMEHYEDLLLSENPQLVRDNMIAFLQGGMDALRASQKRTKN